MRIMELIERYVYAVTQKLPQEQQEDIGEELRSLIADMLDERMESDEATNSDVEKVLLELGNPRKLADKYRDQKRYLIGPEIFDLYLLILKIILTIVIASISIGFIIQTIIEPPNIMEHFIEAIQSLVIGLPMAFGWTTFGFAMGNLHGGIGQKDILGQAWNPSKLPVIPNEKRQIKRGESIVGIVIYAIILVFLAFSSDYFGIWIIDDGFKGTIPFLNVQTYGMYLLFMMLIFGFGIIKECLKLVEGKWTYKLAILTTVVNAISLVAILLIISGGDFWNPTFVNELVDTGILEVGTDSFRVVTKVWEQSTLWIVILLIVGLVWDAVYGFVKARKK